MNTNKETYRYELKYALDPQEAYRFDYFLMNHPAGFRKAFDDRRVNNIYFDNACFEAAELNLAGISDRIKYRYRWYGGIEDFSNGIIEKKIKKNALGCKEYLKIEAPQDLQELSTLIREQLTDKQLSPSLHNCYKRSYFIDRTGSFRLTVDTELSYALPFGEIGEAVMMHPDDRIIVELKFGYDHAKSYDIVSNALPFRISKHSKYVTGLLALLY